MQNRFDNINRQDAEALELKKQEDPGLDQTLLEKNDKDSKDDKLLSAAELTSKLASGQKLTEEERAFLERINPDLLKQSSDALIATQTLERRLKTATSTEEIQQIVAEAKTSASRISRSNALFATLLTENIRDLARQYMDAKQPNSLLGQKASDAQTSSPVNSVVKNQKNEGYAIDMYV